MEFNNKLYSLRKQKGFSQEELANRLNVSRQTVSKWEVGESAPDMENLAAISELFEVSLDELVLGKTPEAPKQEEPSEKIVTSGFYRDIKEHVLTDANKKRAGKGLKIAAVVLGIIILADILSFVIYAVFFGLPG